jgi:PmbA protein
MKDPVGFITSVITSARKAGADAADALLYESASLSASRRMRNPEGLERSESAGFSLRVFIGKRSAVVSSSDTGKDVIPELLERVVAMAKLAPEDPYVGLAPAELLARDIPDLDLYDGNEPKAEWLQEQCAKAEDAALAVKGITNSEGADASYGATHFTLATSNGFAGNYHSSYASVSVSVLAGEGTSMERDYDFASARHLADLAAPEQIGATAAERTLARLHSRKVASQAVPIVFDPRVGRELLGAFTGAINGSSIARGTSFLKDAMGRTVFGESIRIIDDPLRKRGLNSRPFDGEGVKTQKLVLVEKGVLQTWLLDMRSSAKLGLVTTGNATRSLSSPPSPSTSNVYLEAGKISPAELIDDIKQGFYVTELSGMGVNLVTGDFSQGASGFWIENGQKTYAVSEVTIAGKLQDMFTHLTPASDLEFRYSTNTPTLRIEGMMVAGK